MNRWLPLFLYISVITIVAFAYRFNISSAQSVGVTARVLGLPACGNDIKETGEQCDDPDFGGQSCIDFAFTGGTLSCNSDCTINTGQCTTSSGGGGGIGVGGNIVTYPITLPTSMPASEGKYSIADVSRDGRVDIVDFSILGYWYKRSSPPAKVDLNKDGKINLIDFSIMAYYWSR
ncbi:MAG: dockerin type I repeat-containing protein [Candidatus Liptonbacteria bacterium]